MNASHKKNKKLRRLEKLYGRLNDLQVELRNLLKSKGVMDAEVVGRKSELVRIQNAIHLHCEKLTTQRSYE